MPPKKKGSDDAEAKRQRKIKQMSRNLGIDINAVARMLEKSEREEAEGLGGGESSAPAAAASSTHSPLRDFLEKHESESQEEGGGASSNGTASAAAAAETSAGTDAKPDAAGAAAAASGAEEAAAATYVAEATPGTVLVQGTSDWSAIQPKDPMAGGLATPHRLVMEIPAQRRIVAVYSGCTACHTVAVDNVGAAYIWGKNDSGQLGLGTLGGAVSAPTLVPGLEGKAVISASCGKAHTLLVTRPLNDASSGWEALATGAGKCGQLGNGRQTATRASFGPVELPDGAKPRQVGAGAEFSVILDSRGRIYSFGHPEYGQLGHNTTGEYFVSASKLTSDWVTRPKMIELFKGDEAGSWGNAAARDLVDIHASRISFASIACGKNHVLALEGAPPAAASAEAKAANAESPRVFSWGFAGYGRLGHNNQENQLVPRSISVLGRLQGQMSVAKIAAGATHSLAVSHRGHLWYWGKLPNSPRGEAIMYPRQETELYDWNVRCMAAGGQSVLLGAESSVICWGVGVSGELGLGPNVKRSGKASKVEALEGLCITRIAMGLQHAVIIASDESDAHKAKLGALPEFVPPKDSGGGARAAAASDEEDTGSEGADDDSEEEEEVKPQKGKKRQKKG